MASITDAIDKIIPGGGQLNPTQKVALVIAAIISLSLIGAMVYYTGQVEYRVLYSNLSSQDAGLIVSKLQEKKTPYKLAADGSSISIPSDKVSEVRLELAAAGLPQGGGVGFEIFDQKAIGATDFEQQMNYRRALQGELARTINSLDEIQASRVHIALPKDSLFVQQQKKSTASVTLRLKPGKSLNPSQIEGIAQLVASSVEGMQADDVMVVDSRGNILSKKYQDARFAKLNASQIEYQRNIEMQLAASLQSLLDNVVGAGNAVVRVAADINFAIIEKTEEVFDAENPVIRSTQKQTERNVTTPAGAASAAGAAGEAPSEKEKTSEVLNFEISKVTSRTILPTGNIQKLSIAAVVDGNYKKNEKGEVEYQPRTKEELDALEDLLRKSSGLNRERGDQVVVTNIAFKKPPTELDAGAIEASWQDTIAVYFPVIKYFLMMLVVFFIAMFLVRPLIRAASRSSAPREISPQQLSLPDGQRIDVLETPSADAFAITEKVIDEVAVVKKLAETDAKRVAELLKTWIK